MNNIQVQSDRPVTVVDTEEYEALKKVAMEVKADLFPNKIVAIFLSTLSAKAHGASNIQDCLRALGQEGITIQLEQNSPNSLARIRPIDILISTKS